MTSAPSPGLPEPLGLLSAALSLRHSQDPNQLRQPQVDALRAHAEAQQRLSAFGALLGHYAQRVGVPAQQRPGGVKALDRYVEKYLNYDLVPLDILAAKLVFPSLISLYQAAQQLDQVFAVAGFRDRFARPRTSGYRDLQFVVDLGGHLAEIKLCHRLFDELDVHEHTLYELRRRLESRAALSEIELLVLDKLGQVSADLFDEVWVRVQKGG